MQGRALLQESERYGDIAPALMVDTYLDLMEKTIATFRLGLAARALLIVKMDDDTCFRLADDGMWSAYEQLRRPQYGYFGLIPHNGTEYESMKVVNNQTAPYFGGPAYALTTALARAIFEDDLLFVSQHQAFGSSSEDVTVGHLVHRFQRLLVSRGGHEAGSVVSVHNRSWRLNVTEVDADSEWYIPTTEDSVEDGPDTSEKEGPEPGGADP